MKKRFDAVSEEEIDLVFFLTKMYQWTLSLRVSYIKNSSFYGKRLATVLFRALLEIIGEMINTITPVLNMRRPAKLIVSRW